MPDIMSKVSQKDRDNARLDRESTLNPPDIEPGMDDGFGFDDDDDDDFGGFGGGGDSDFGGFGGFDNGGSEFGGFGGFGGFGDSPVGGSSTPQTSSEDKIWEAIIGFFKGTYGFIGEFVKSFKTFKGEARLNFGRYSMTTGAIVGGMSIIFLLFGKLYAFNLLVGGLLSIGVGVMFFMPEYGRLRENQQAPTQQTNQPTNFDPDDDGFDFDDDDDAFGGFDTIGNDKEEDEFSFDENDNTPKESGYTLDDLDFSAFEDKDTQTVDTDKILDSVDIDKGMVTRQYLFETFYKVLPDINTKFNDTRIIDENSDEFDAWNSVITRSADMLKTGNSEEKPYLISAKDKLFYYILEVKRVKWLKKAEDLIREVVDVYRFDTDTGKMDESIYGTGQFVGDRIYITIMKGTSAMIGLKDAYTILKDEILDTKNMMPVILGVDSEGGLVWEDFKPINSLAITGMPRSGKTWTVESIFTQLCAFLKPSELNIYFLDPKGGISDYRVMTMPHVRKFVSDNTEILNELRYVVNVEGKRRSDFLGEKGFTDIKDYKAKYPDTELPFIYVIVDEVVALSKDMDKETKAEFQGLLATLISKLPAVGIRLVLVPHVIKNDIVEKTASDLIPCRISVKGDASHIESCLGTKPKDFKYKLVNVGDMAVRLGNDSTKFVHGLAIAKNNEANKEIFDFLTRFWLKIEPESYKGSFLEQLDHEKRKDDSSSTPTLDLKPKSVKQKSSAKDNSKLSKSDVDDLLSSIDEDLDDDIDVFGGVFSEDK